MAAKNDLVHVVHGANDGEFAIAGTSVGSVKRSLRDAFNIPYFAEARVNGKRVKVDHVLANGDRLEFIQVFGYKGAKKEPRAKVEARGMLAHYPELLQIRNQVEEQGLDKKQSLDLMAALVARWCEDHFGPVMNDKVATLNEVISKLTKLRDRATPLTHDKQPRKPGRKNTTRELADFAEAHKGLTRKEIAALWNEKHPTGKKVKEEDVRGASRRSYGDKAASYSNSKKKRPNH